MKHVTATEAARNFSELLNRVTYQRESFVILRNGEEAGVLIPAAPRTTLRGLLEILHNMAGVDDSFGDDLEKIQAQQPSLPESPWES